MLIPTIIHLVAVVLGQDDFFEKTPLFSGKLYGREPKGPLMEDVPGPAEVSGASLPLKPLSDILPPQPPSSVQLPTNPSPSCSFEPNKWKTYSNTSIIRAIMFQRTTGQSCGDCLKSCSLQQSAPWVCRSVVFDSRWNICDLFAVTAANPPFDVVSFDGRTYFEYLPAMPPSDSELHESVLISARDQFNQVQSCQPSNTQTRTEGLKLYSSVPVELQLQTEEKTAAAVKKRGEKRRRNHKKVDKGTETVETTTTTTARPALLMSSSTTDDYTDIWDMDDVSEGSGKGSTAETTTQTTTATTAVTEAFTTMKPRRLMFKGPRGGKKLHGTRTTLPDELAGFVDIADVQKKELPASNAICTEDDVVAMVEFISTKRRKPFGGDIVKSNANTTEECSEKCEKDDDCSSALFTPTTGCQLASTKSKRTRTDLITTPGFTYVEKICLRRNVAKGRGRLFSAVRNFIITGFVEEVEDARSMEDCIGMCLKARRKHGFHCLSAMWYPVDKEQNCVLNREAGSRKPEHFDRADQSIQMVYLEVPDAIDVREASVDSRRYKDLPVNSKWTMWSSCEGREKDDLRYRYKKCSDQSDVRKCPRQTAFCGSNPLRSPKASLISSDTMK